MSSRNLNPGLVNALLSRPPVSFWDEITAFFREHFEVTVPEGFEDESGFHFGTGRAGSRPMLECYPWSGEHI